MLRNYFTTAFRNLIKNKIFSVINIVGLSIGIAACLLISLYVNYEISYDKHVDDIDNLYRVLYERESETGETVQFASASPTVGPVITANLPEIEKCARAYKMEGGLSIGDISFREEFPDGTRWDPQGAFRASTTIGTADMALSFFHGWSRFPVLNQELTSQQSYQFFLHNLRIIVRI